MIKLKELRQNSGKQSKEIAFDLSISKQAYSNYELGQREPSIEMLIKLADYFGVSVDYLIRHDSNAEQEFKIKKAATITDADSQFIESYLNADDETKNIVQKSSAAIIKERSDRK